VQSNLSLFNQEGDTSLFGSIRLFEYSNTNSLKSQILNGEQQCFELLKLCDFSPNDKWKLLYRGTRDGFKPRGFNSKCDGHSNTLTLLRAKHSKFIFGGFTMAKWESSPKGKWKSDRNAFIFSLTNKDSRPVKIKIDPNEYHRAIFCQSECGPSFGGVHDNHIANDDNNAMFGCSNLCFAYMHPQYEYGTNEAQSFLAGSHEFQLDEIEVYEKE
jgi:BTB/POZ domain-containing protein KCTD9